MASKSQLNGYKESRRYAPSDAPVFSNGSEELRRVLELVWIEFDKIRIAIDRAHDHDALVVEPIYKRDFYVRFADGAPGWDPGLGRGPYYYDEVDEKWYKMVGEAVGGGGSVQLDHGGLLGLLDDDHPQYLTTTRGDARYYTQSEVDVLINIVNQRNTVELTAGEALSQGDVCYVGATGLFKADASAENTCDTQLFICNEALSATQTGEFIARGLFVTSSLTAGSILYASSTTPGAITHVIPDSDGEVIRIVGTALSTTLMYFNPDVSYYRLGV